jgi:hydroxymethylglutaryl-CoA reductase (NADPH)
MNNQNKNKNHPFSLKLYDLEKELPNLEEAVKIRRNIVENDIIKRVGRKLACNTKTIFKDLPFKNYSYELVHGRCCENVVGYMQVPVGLAGPILVDDKDVYLPMATTEGTLVASTSRGCKAITSSGGCQTAIVHDGMTRAPVIKCPSVKECVEIKKFCADKWLDIREVFNSTSSHAKLTEIKSIIVGKYIFLRFQCTTGDAMGMNMTGKGTEESIKFILRHFPHSQLKSLSGNVCVDKKASAMNWIEGRGKSVVCEAIILSEVVEKLLKTTVEKLVEINYIKNMIGSSVAATVGGNNAHAANIVAAMFLACGQDIAQVVESSHCMTLMEYADNQKDLYVSVTMPCLEVGTVGGGTHLPSQSAMLKLIELSTSTISEEEREKDVDFLSGNLARVISSAVLAGELSLLSALSNNDLMKAHLLLNRKN